jgi:hypothetical protein
MKYLAVSITVILIVLVNIYLFRGIRSLFSKEKHRKIFQYAFWAWTLPLPILLFAVATLPTEYFRGASRSLILTYSVTDIIVKLILLVFFAVDDFLHFTSGKIGKNKNNEPGDTSRKQFLKKTGLAVSVIPITGFSFGIIKGAHDYTWRKIQVNIKGLPDKFDGIRIGQLSDIHSGSFSNKNAVRGGIEMFMAEKPDLVFFTGDIVNDQAWELKNYIDLFSKVKAPLGVYSVLGNHDYGNYSRWKSKEAKQRNFKGILDGHSSLGWTLLRNENRVLEIEGDKLAIIGVENWGASSRFPKYGDLDKAKQGLENIDSKILLSHDPSHWEAKILPEHKDIDLTLSGHTHGFQFGIETPFFRWSPAQYLYRQWAGLYEQNGQHIYVNRGFGYIGYPGRIGIPPELTLIELKKV